jgi:HEAT repeat protein
MAENDGKGVSKRTIIIIFIIGVILLPAGIYYFRVYGVRTFDPAPLWEADGPARAAAAQELALANEMDGYAAGFFAMSESKLDEVVGPIKRLYDQLTENRSEDDYYLFYETAASRIPASYMPRLETAWNDASDAERRGRALFALAAAKNPSAAGFLKEALGDADPGVRNKAIRLLGRYGGPDAADLLLKAADDSNEAVALAAKDALLSAFGRVALGKLSDELLSPDAVTRERANRRLKFLLDKDCGFDARADEETRMQAFLLWKEEIRKFLK